MQRLAVAAALSVAILALADLPLPDRGAARAQPQSQPARQAPPAWSGCCGARPWAQDAAPSAQGGGMMGQGMMGGGGMMGPQGGMMSGGGMMGGAGSMRRHRVAMMQGVPAPYAGMENPLPRTAATVERGAKVFAGNCASCHGPGGQGDGPAAAGLNPRPANLAWLSNMPLGRRDAFLYWTIAEGGGAFGTAMPAFKSTLSKDQIWAVAAYIQAHLPAAQARR